MSVVCKPHHAIEAGKTPTNKHHYHMKTKLSKGECPYSDGLRKSTLDGRVKFPPVDVYLFADGNKCHTKCGCGKGTATTQLSCNEHFTGLRFRPLRETRAMLRHNPGWENH